jgi:Methyltransferase domain
MNLQEIVDSLSVVSLRTLFLARRNRSNLRAYVGYCLRRYDELAGRGLPIGSPAPPAFSDTITLPAAHSGGGMSFAEMVIMARVTKTRRPRTVFEMGSYDGLTTAVFLLNAPADARVISLDLPPESASKDDHLDSDKVLVAARTLGAVPRAIGLDNYTQLLCDSMEFDPSPYLNSVDLGLVDAAHDVVHASNDTIKMARMLTADGIVFWHDYGGKGDFRPLAEYLESLGRKCSMFRIPETSLAWAHAKELKRAVL